MSIQNEFSHPVHAESIGSATPFTAKLTADANTRQKLAERFGILSIESLEANITITREANGFTLYVKGNFDANITQSCVTTLEPVPAHLAEAFEAWYLDETNVTSFARARKSRQAPAADADDEIEENPMPDERDDPEALIDGVMDIGELVAQYISLALPAFPHSPKAKEQGFLGDEADLKPESPFSALKDLLEQK